MKKITISMTLLSIIIFLLPSVFAFEYTLSSPQLTKPAQYETDSASFRAAVFYEGDTCKISCRWYTDRDSDNFDCLKSYSPCPINFNVDAKPGQGSIQGTLTVICNLPGSAWPVCIGQGDQQQTETYDFTYLYLGDGKCTTSDNYEDCQKAPYPQYPDCPCPSGKKCMYDISRPKDDRGCTTYCGNGVKESDYENCDNCPADVGKCDGASCISGSECEGEYCVHEVCWNKPYKEGDGFCDSYVNENCKNSPSDCKCQIHERCGSSGTCETYCGNGICEDDEKGTCKADCDWCGDGECTKGESCNNCPNDCGICEESNKETINKTKEIVEKATKESRQKMTIGLLGTSGALVILVIAYIIYKLVKGRKKKSGAKKKKKKRK